MTLYLKGYQKYDRSKSKSLNLLNKSWTFDFEFMYFWYPLRYKVIQYLIGKLSDMVKIGMGSTSSNCEDILKSDSLLHLANCASTGGLAADSWWDSSIILDFLILLPLRRIFSLLKRCTVTALVLLNIKIIWAEEHRVRAVPLMLIVSFGVQAKTIKSN